MFEFIKKKKISIGGGPNKGDEDESEESIEAPEVDGTISDLDAALAAADRVKVQKKRDEAAERERLREQERAASSGGSCGCGGGRW